MANGKQYYCKNCNRTMAEEQFYTSNNIEKYPPEGKMPECKKCLTRHVDNFNPETYLWILQEIDVPYIPDQWNQLMMKYAKDRTKLTGTTILGRYLAKMKLNQWKQFRWSDNEHLRELENLKLEQTMKQQGYDAGEIALAIEKKNSVVIPEGELLPPPPPAIEHLQEENEDYFSNISGGNDGFDDDLTDEDRTYLRLKWGKTYKPEEWVKLEQLYEEMMGSYDIQTAGHIDTLKLICKTSLKANQLLDLGDVDGAQKMIKMYDGLMKSGKFTAAQNKAEQGEFIDSISELVELCEKEGFIPRYYIEQPKDRVDETLQDLKNYTKTLVVEEMNLGNLIENAIKEMAKEEAKQEDEDIEEELTFDELDAIKDEDFEEYNDFLESETEEDNIMFLDLLKDE